MTDTSPAPEFDIDAVLRDVYANPEGGPVECCGYTLFKPRHCDAWFERAREFIDRARRVREHWWRVCPGCGEHFQPDLPRRQKCLSCRRRVAAAEVSKRSPAKAAALQRGARVLEALVRKAGYRSYDCRVNIPGRDGVYIADYLEGRLAPRGKRGESWYLGEALGIYHPSVFQAVFKPPMEWTEDDTNKILALLAECGVSAEDIDAGCRTNRQDG